MPDEEAQGLRRENEYLKARCVQLQNDVTDLTSELERQRQRLERGSLHRAGAPPNPLAGGQ